MVLRAVTRRSSSYLCWQLLSKGHLSCGGETSRCSENHSPPYSFNAGTRTHHDIRPIRNSPNSESSSNPRIYSSLCPLSIGAALNYRNYSSAAPPGAAVLSPSIDKDEVAKFQAEAAMWWDTKGPHEMLHRMSPVRVSFIRSALCRLLKLSDDELRPLKGIKVLDVGCGGGLLAEPLSRLGASVTGIDVVPSNIQVARLHAEQSQGLTPINYICTSAEDLVEQGHKYDVVTCLEVIEHVADPLSFIRTLSSLCEAKDGILFLSTINRTPSAMAAAVVAAEYLLRWVPVGTHDWSKFLTPAELAAMLRSQGPLVMENLAGMSLNPLTGQWALTSDTSINYIAVATHPSPPS